MAKLFRKNGDPAKRVGITENKRARLEAPRHVRPWTTQPEVRSRGLATQLTQPNILHEFVDLRIIHAFHLEGAAYNSPAPKELVVDIRQETNY